MTPVQFHEFDWLPEDALNGRTSLPKTSMLASMPAGKGDVTLIHKNIRSAWVLSLRPDNVGIPAYKNEQCSYNELLVIHAELSEKANSSGIVRLQEMFHRSIPYPLFLWLAHGPAYFYLPCPCGTTARKKARKYGKTPSQKSEALNLSRLLRQPCILRFLIQQTCAICTFAGYDPCTGLCFIPFRGQSSWETHSHFFSPTLLKRGPGPGVLFPHFSKNGSL